MIKIIDHSRLVIQRRGLHIPELTAFFDKQEALIWARVGEITDLHIASLTAFKPTPPFDTRPHFV